MFIGLITMLKHVNNICDIKQIRLQCHYISVTGCHVIKQLLTVTVLLCFFFCVFYINNHNVVISSFPDNDNALIVIILTFLLLPYRKLTLLESLICHMFMFASCRNNLLSNKCSACNSCCSIDSNIPKCLVFHCA